MGDSNNIFWIALAAIASVAIGIGYYFRNRITPIEKEIIRVNDITFWINNNKKGATKCYVAKVSEVPDNLLQEITKSFGVIESPQTSLWLTLTDNEENLLRNTVIKGLSLAEDITTLLDDKEFVEITI